MVCVQNIFTKLLGDFFSSKVYTYNRKVPNLYKPDFEILEFVIFYLKIKKMHVCGIIGKILLEEN